MQAYQVKVDEEQVPNAQPVLVGGFNQVESRKGHFPVGVKLKKTFETTT